MNSQTSGILTSTTPVVIAAAGLSCPFSVTLKSSAGGRKIELSTDTGTEFFTPPTDTSSSATMQIVTVEAPVTHVRFTGQADDKWFINASGVA